MRYYLKDGDEPEREVTKKDYLNAEQRAGKISKFGRDHPATNSFSCSRTRLGGRIVYDSIEEEIGEALETLQRCG